MPKGAKRVMESFIIREISFVDVPAQEGARAIIMKSTSFDMDSEMPPLDKLESDLEVLRKEPDKLGLKQLLADCNSCYESHMGSNGGLEAFMRSDDFKRINRVHRTAASLINASGKRTAN